MRDQSCSSPDACEHQDPIRALWITRRARGPVARRTRARARPARRVCSAARPGSARPRGCRPAPARRGTSCPVKLPIATPSSGTPANRGAPAFTRRRDGLGLEAVGGLDLGRGVLGRDRLVPVAERVAEVGGDRPVAAPRGRERGDRAPSCSYRRAAPAGACSSGHRPRPDRRRASAAPPPPRRRAAHQEDDQGEEDPADASPHDRASYRREGLVPVQH